MLTTSQKPTIDTQKLERKEHKHAYVLNHLICVHLLVTPWTVACQAPLSMGFSRQEHWSELPCSPPGDLPDPEIKPLFPVSPVLQVDSLLLSHQGSLHALPYIINYSTQGVV